MNEDEAEYYLYSDIHGVFVDALSLPVDLAEGDKISRTLSFSAFPRFPFQDDKLSPNGVYKIYVAIYQSDIDTIEWLPTKMYINVDI
jgi:hypothetical protein